MSTPPGQQPFGRTERILVVVVVLFVVSVVAAMAVPAATVAAAAAIFDRSPRAIMVVSSIGMAIPLVLAAVLLLTTSSRRMLRIVAGAIVGIGLFCDLLVSSGQLTQPLSGLRSQARESGDVAISAAMGVAAWCCMIALGLWLLAAIISALVVLARQGSAGFRRRSPAPQRKGKTPVKPGPVQWFAGWRVDAAGAIPPPRRAFGWCALVCALGLVVGAIVLVV